MQVFRGSIGRTLLVFSLCLFLESVPTWCQNTFGTIVGTVNDNTGAAVSGATVTLTNDETGERRTGSTDSSGDYQFVSLTPDNYKLEIEATGFKHTPVTASWC